MKIEFFKIELSPIVTFLMTYSGVLKDLQFATVFSEHFTIELKAIVRNEHVRNAKPSNDVLPDESFCIHISDVG